MRENPKKSEILNVWSFISGVVGFKKILLFAVDNGRIKGGHYGIWSRNSRERGHSQRCKMRKYPKIVKNGEKLIKNIDFKLCKATEK